jgi:hypothetical protein
MIRLGFAAAVLAVLTAACAEKPTATKATAAKDPKIAAAEERINKTTPDGKTIIEKVLGMKPEVNEIVSTKTLKEISDDYAQNKGAYNTTPIGWEASQKKPLANEKTGRWKVIYHYQDYTKAILAAEWEYNPETNKVYPFEFANAPQFHSTEGAPKTAGTKGK